MAEEKKKEEEATIPTPEELELKAQGEVKKEEEEEGVVETPDYETEASASGWKNEEDHTGDAPWIDAKEFVLRKPLFDAIHKLSKKNKDLDATVTNLVEHNRKIEVATRKKVIEELKQQKVNALENDDHAAVVEIDDRIADAKSTPAVEATPVKSAEFIDFVEKNPWYEEKMNMKRYATRIGYEYVDKYPDAPEADVFAHVESVIKDAYPDEFKPAPNPKRKAAPAVGAPKGGSPAKANKKTLTLDDLSFEERSIMKNMLRNSPLTEKEYLEQLPLVRA